MSTHFYLEESLDFSRSRPSSRQCLPRPRIVEVSSRTRGRIQWVSRGKAIAIAGPTNM